ncbi:MAG: hypothetical protein EPN23_07485 [Verrucomicrobia bacterium]|nr:MAG: hypothetical protein EPN23_07485 [Verrucomicrobiota bacterium]
MAALLRSAGAPTATCAGACAPNQQNPLPVFQPLENQTTTFSSQTLRDGQPLAANDWKIPQTIFQSLENCLRVVVVFLALSICGCAPSQKQEQQCAAKYNALMKNWFSEYYGNMTNYDALKQPIFESALKTKNPNDIQKWRSLVIGEMRETAIICGKYADLLSKETPPDFLQLPFSESQKMLAAMRDGHSEAARLWEAGNRELGQKVLDEKMKIVGTYEKTLVQWMKIHDPAGYQKYKSICDFTDSSLKKLNSQSAK